MFAWSRMNKHFNIVASHLCLCFAALVIYKCSFFFSEGTSDEEAKRPSEDAACEDQGNSRLLVRFNPTEPTQLKSIISQGTGQVSESFAKVPSEIFLPAQLYSKCNLRTAEKDTPADIS